MGSNEIIPNTKNNKCKRQYLSGGGSDLFNSRIFASSTSGVFDNKEAEKLTNIQIYKNTNSLLKMLSLNIIVVMLTTIN